MTIYYTQKNTPFPNFEIRSLYLRINISYSIMRKNNFELRSKMDDLSTRQAKKFIAKKCGTLNAKTMMNVRSDKKLQNPGIKNKKGTYVTRKIKKIKSNPSRI